MPPWITEKTVLRWKTVNSTHSINLDQSFQWAQSIQSGWTYAGSEVHWFFSVTQSSLKASIGIHKLGGIIEVFAVELKWQVLTSFLSQVHVLIWGEVWGTEK